MSKKVRLSLVIVILVLFIAIAGAKPMIEKNLEGLKSLKIENVDLTKIPDGTYFGMHKAFPITAEVSVTVESSVITDIKLLKHDNGKGKAAEAIPEEVIQKQTLDVDVVSGATYSSKIILKAIENALK